MFRSIRNRLTLQYTAFTAIALLLFAILFYYSLSSLLLREQEQEVMTLALEQAVSDTELFDKQADEKGKRDDKGPDDIRPVPGEAYFYYGRLGDGRLLSGREPHPELRTQILAAVSEWNTRTAATVTARLPDGRSMSYVVAGAPVHDDGEKIGMVFVGKDLGAYYHVLKRLAQALTLSVAVFLLIAAVAGYYAAGKALVPIRSAFAAQQQFVADASHELRTPLSIFQASLEVVERLDGGKLTGDSRKILADLQDETRRMARLVGDLLTLARADSGALEMLRDNVDVRPVAEQAVRAVSSLAAGKDIAVTLTAADPVTLYADKDRLAQLLVILLDNAIKFTPPGGRVSLAIQPDGGRQAVKITVADTGLGMTTDEVQHIFKRFYRADKVRTREDGGAGLGLSIAAWIVEVHGGTIAATSEKGRGSVFTVCLPSKDHSISPA